MCVFLLYSNCASKYVTLDIVQEPSITCTKHHISVGHIECHIHNYSEFVNVSIVKDDVTRIETYHASDACTLTVSEPNVARCRIELQQEGSFKICMNYTSIVCHVEPLHRCSHYVHVNDGESTYTREKQNIFQ